MRALREFVRTPAPPRCELCAAPLGPRHDHLLETDGDTLRCACDGCALLFAHDAASKRLVRREVAVLEDSLATEDFDSLGLPIGLAMLMRRGGRIVARYPSPAGLVESTLTGDELAPAGAHLLDRLEPDVEALLFRREGRQLFAYRVSIDVCRELAGVLARDWRGLGGGPKAWAAATRFFDALEVEARRGRPRAKGGAT